MDQRIVEFLKSNRVAVLATPHASAMHFTYDENNSVIHFITTKGSRKLMNLDEASVVVGFSEQEWVTVQMDGKIEMVESTQSIRDLILLKYPEDAKYMDTDAVFLKFTPTWWRYSDYKNNLFLENK